MTRNMMSVLIQLRSAQAFDSPFISLPGVDPRTISALYERDWITGGSGFDGQRYKITGRGLKALAVYEPQVKRTDGLCPRCSERPRRMRKTGIAAPYCGQCESRMQRRNYVLGLNTPNPELPCCRCRKRSRYIASTGKVYTECRHCKNLRQRRRHKRERRELLARIVAGEHIGCRKAGCEQQRWVTGKTVQDFCREHQREFTSAYNARRRAKSPMAAHP